MWLGKRVFIITTECQYQYFNYHTFLLYSDSAGDRIKVTVYFNELYTRTSIQPLKNVQHLAILAFKVYIHFWFMSILRQEQVYLMMTGLEILSVFCPVFPSSRIIS